MTKKELKKLSNMELLALSSSLTVQMTEIKLDLELISQEAKRRNKKSIFKRLFKKNRD